MEHSPIDTNAAPSPPTTAAALCAHYNIKLKPASRRLLHDGLSPQAFFARLMRDDACLADARGVLACALPKRRALWWGCLCAWDAYRPQPPEETQAALQTVAQFVLSPTEANRRAAEDLARGAPRHSIECCLANAVFYSGGSVLRVGLPHVPPRPMMTGRLVSLAVYLASLRPGPRGYRDRLKQYLAIGLELAKAESLDLLAKGAPAPARLDRPELSLRGPHIGALAASAIAISSAGKQS